MGLQFFFFFHQCTISIWSEGGKCIVAIMFSEWALIGGCYTSVATAVRCSLATRLSNKRARTVEDIVIERCSGLPRFSCHIVVQIT